MTAQSHVTVAGPVEKTTVLLDALERPLRDLRISITDVCNYRCLYCMPPEIDPNFFSEKERLTRGEIRRLAGGFVSLGVKRLRITGGEPLVRPDVNGIVADLASLPGIEEVTMTTNGHKLADHAQALKHAGLDRITVSMDALDADLFRHMTGGRGDVVRVIAGVKAALAAGLSPVKINCVLQRGVNESQILPLARWARQEGLVLRFIEFMDVGNRNHWDSSRVVPSAEVVELLRTEFALEAIKPRFFGEVAEAYRYVDAPGEVGFISSVSQPFCSSCTRGRLAADGTFYTCLFSGRGTNLRGFLKSENDEGLTEVIRGIWRQRTNRYSEERAGVPRRQHDIVEMFKVGG